MQTTSYIAAEDIEQGDLLSYSSATALAILLKRADSGEAIIARAAQDCKEGSSIQVTLLEAGMTTTVICGDTITAGDHIDGADGKAIVGTSSLIAIDSGSSGSRIRVVKTASDNSPAVADKAKALDTDGRYVGGPSNHMYFLNTGRPVAGSATIGNASTPIYMQTGEFRACSLPPAFDPANFYATDAEGCPAVGAIALFSISGLSSNVAYGAVIEVTSSITARVESLGVDDNSAVKSEGWTTPKKLPEGAKLRALSTFSTGSDLSKAVILGIVTYLPEPEPEPEPAA